MFQLQFTTKQSIQLSLTQYRPSDVDPRFDMLVDPFRSSTAAKAIHVRIRLDPFQAIRQLQLPWCSVLVDAQVLGRQLQGSLNFDYGWLTKTMVPPMECEQITTFCLLVRLSSSILDLSRLK